MRYRHELKAVLAIAAPSILFTSLAWFYLSRGRILDFIVQSSLCGFICIAAWIYWPQPAAPRRARRRRSRFVFLP